MVKLLVSLSLYLPTFITQLPNEMLSISLTHQLPVEDFPALWWISLATPRSVTRGTYPETGVRHFTTVTTDSVALVTVLHCDLNIDILIFLGPV